MLNRFYYFVYLFRLMDSIIISKLDQNKEKYSSFRRIRSENKHKYLRKLIASRSVFIIFIFSAII